MADQIRVLDVAHTLAVVVDDSHLAAFFQDLLAFHKAHLVCIHHHAQGALGDDGQCVLRVDEVILLARPAQRVDQAARQRGVPLHGDHRRDVADLADAQYALAAPMASRSLMRWPMMTTWSASLMSLTSWSATMRLRTLLRFSTPWLTPP